MNRLALQIMIGTAIFIGSFFVTLTIIDSEILPFRIGNFAAKDRNLPYNIPHPKIDQSFAVRIVLVPAATQVDWASLISSITTDNRGFAILHKPNVSDAY